MKHSFKIGFSFGLTSAVITTLGLMVGLEAGTSSRLAVIGGVLTVAVADAFSDALGIHVSEESENIHSTKEIWTSTLTAFFTKAIFASLFIIPVLLLELSTAIIVSVIFGLSLIAVFSYITAKQQQKHALSKAKGKPWSIVGEHLLIATIVIIATHYLGLWINKVFS